MHLETQDLLSRSFRVPDGDSDVPGATVVLSWADLARVNDPETMEEIAEIALGERTILGMCDPIERVS